jgi:hypothetical protein
VRACVCVRVCVCVCVCVCGCTRMCPMPRLLPLSPQPHTCSLFSEQTQQKGTASVKGRTTASVPSSVDAFRRVLEVQLHALVNKARIARHHNRPACVGCGHAGHIEPFLPLLVDPLEGEGVGHLYRQPQQVSCTMHLKVTSSDVHDGDCKSVKVPFKT